MARIGMSGSVDVGRRGRMPWWGSAASPRRFAAALRRLGAALRRLVRRVWPAPGRNLAPDLRDAPYVLRQRVDELARAGAIDEGSVDAFRPMIDSWVEQWRDQVQDEFDDRLAVYQIRTARSEAELQRLRYLAEHADRLLDEADQRLRRVRGELEKAPTPRPRHEQPD